MSEDKITKSDEQWRAQLKPEQYEVTRRHGTERAFSGEYWDVKDTGTYCCSCCGAELFASDAKYDSRSGWPSYYEPVSEEVLTRVEDRSIGMARTEVLCQRCDAHLGHVFPDGPEPTGLRYCINSASLRLERDAAKDEGS